MSEPIVKIKVNGTWHIALKVQRGMDSCACCSLKEECGPGSVIKTVCWVYGFGFRECPKEICDDKDC